MSAPEKPRGRGRPRTLPAGTTPSDRARMADAALRRAGGYRIGVELGAAAWEALQRLAPPRRRSAMVSQLILAADRANRLQGAGADDRPKGAGAGAGADGAD